MEDGSDGEYASSGSTTPSEQNADVAQLPSMPRSKSFRTRRSRTQSDSAAWTRATFRMNETSGGNTPGRSPNFVPDDERRMMNPSVISEVSDFGEPSDNELSESFLEVTGRFSLPMLPTDLLEGLEDEDESEMDAGILRGRRTPPKIGHQFIRGLSREGAISMWREQGEISTKASEILEDARLSMHGNETNLYQSSAQRLSHSDDPILHSLGEKMVTQQVEAEQIESTSLDKDHQSPELTPRDSRESISDATLDSTPEERLDDSSPRPSLAHDPVRWEGVLSRRSEWLRRIEKHYYVLEGKYLRRFPSKRAYLASRDEPFVDDAERDRKRSASTGSTTTPPPTKSTPAATAGTVSHLYVLAGVKDSSSRVNGFTFITEDKKTLQLNAPNAVEKIIWMRLGLEAIVAIPTLALPPLDMEEFYAMLVVLYTSYRGNWKTEGDMAVTLPPPSEQVFTRFFRLLDKDVIFCSNYAPSVPFHGSYRGHAGVVSYMHEFSKSTIWSGLQIGGMSVEGSIAVASGKEVLENKRDGRKFLQNWVHKFSFYTDGRLARFEINGDVVAASAVFKVPGAATTLKLPQDYNEVDAEHGLDGSLHVRIMQAKGLKMGTAVKKTVKRPSVSISIVHGEATDAKPKASSSLSAFGGISMPSLPKRLNSGLSILANATRNSSLSISSKANSNTKSTGVPRNMAESPNSPANPVWNEVLIVPFQDVIGTCSLQVMVEDQSRSGNEATIGYTSVNVANILMASDPFGHDDDNNASNADSQWYSLRNDKGEYCGKVLLGISCRRDDVADDVGSTQVLRKSVSLNVGEYRSPAGLEDWSQTPSLATPAMPVHSDSNLSRSTSSVKSEEFISDRRQHGWSNVKLSPEAPRSGSDLGVQSSESASSMSGNSDAVACKDNDSMHSFMVCGAPFTIPKHYQLIKVCGRGAYGIVIAATDTLTGGNVAIKKVIDCVWHPHQLKQILREVRLLRHMAHENILSLMDLIPPPSYADFRDVYMTIDLMEMDLHRIIYSREMLVDDHVRYFLYQLLSGLHHMHQAGVLHRDLKPSNLLINSDCKLKICDFGLARSMDGHDAGMTEYVVTRWYRAPELLLGSAYGEGVDLWAAGCIFAEMLGRKPLFPGETYVHQLQLIMNILGVPEEHSFKENPMANKLKGRQLLSRTQAVAGMDVSTMFPNANPEGLDLLWKMLVFDAEKRITVEEALRHPYLADYYDEERETRPVEPYHAFDLDDLDESDLKELMFKEICHFHPEEMTKRAQHQERHPEKYEKLPPGWVKRESRSVPGKFYYSNPKRGVSTWNKEEMD